jgi:hypothetical protein
MLFAKEVEAFLGSRPEAERLSCFGSLVVAAMSRHHRLCFPDELHYGSDAVSMSGSSEDLVHFTF